jgi:hypothetical protein
MTVDGLIKLLHDKFLSIKDHRKKNCSYKLSDLLMTGFSIFHQKDASLLAFRDQFPSRSENMKRIYGLENIPEDTCLRECLDGVEPNIFHSCFEDLFSIADSEGILKSKFVLGKKLVVSFDGTGYYSSSNIHCPHCLTKEHKNGKTTYHHQMLGAVLVSPHQATVLPLYAEPIVNEDGHTKNDCERNALKRLLPKTRQIVKEQSIVAVLDALYADGPTIRALQEVQMDYIIGIKEGYVLIQVEKMRREQKLQESSTITKGIKKVFSWTRQLILNGVNQNMVVNYLGCEEIDIKTGKTIFKNTWITNLEVSSQNISEMVQIARSRWKIENETFNTLKNQGYNFEHSFGHGKKFLSSIFALLMLLAFAVDQLAQSADKEFLKAMGKFKTKKGFFKRASAVFDVIPAKSMSAIYRFISGDLIISIPKIE